MNHRTTTVSLLLSGLLAAGGAFAQSSPAAGSSNVPAGAGEASTTSKGVPNAKTTNDASTTNMGATGSTTVQSTTPMGKDAIRQDAKGQGSASATTSVPGRAGEASTMVNGKPNANPDAPTLTKSKAERRTEKEMKRADAKQRRETAIMGQKGAQAGAPAGTPAVSPAGTPRVQDGGTPK